MRMPNVRLCVFLALAASIACGNEPSEDETSTADELKKPHACHGKHTDCDAGADAADDAATTTTTDAGTTTTTTDAGTAPAPAPAPAPTCTSFTYSAWGACQPNGTQTRTVVSSSPAGCTGGTPVLTQSCTYIDGRALYDQYCSGCHGTSKLGSSASQIQSAINNNTGGMGSLSFLTSAQIQAISQAQ